MRHAVGDCGLRIATGRAGHPQLRPKLKGIAPSSPLMRSSARKTWVKRTSMDCSGSLRICSAGRRSRRSPPDGRRPGPAARRGWGSAPRRRAEDPAGLPADATWRSWVATKPVSHGFATYSQDSTTSAPVDVTRRHTEPNLLQFAASHRQRSSKRRSSCAEQLAVAAIVLCKRSGRSSRPPFARNEPSWSAHGRPLGRVE